MWVAAPLCDLRPRVWTDGCGGRMSDFLCVSERQKSL